MRIMVFGAAGHVGSAVVNQLANDGHEVLALKKSEAQPLDVPEGVMVNTYDVVNPPEFFLVEERGMLQGGIDAIIYCVGHCPPNGFRKAIKHPLSRFDGTDLDHEIGMHMKGPHHVFHEFLRLMNGDGHFVFMSTAATRILEMPRDKRPPIHIYHHLAVIDGMNALIEGMRVDPEAISLGIKVHRVAPPRISDSPFHKGDETIPADSKAPMSVTTAEVVQAIAGCLQSHDHQDVVMLPALKP